MKRVALALPLLLANPAEARASILSRVLEIIAGLSDRPVAGAFVNMATNETPDSVLSQIGREARSLRAGDMVVVGYDPAGRPVEVVAGPAGLILTPDTAGRLAHGLSAGIYPVGSAVYDLPPAGRLSLYAESAEGARLARARDFTMTRIDGSITTVMTGLVPPELAEVYVLDVKPAAHGDVGEIAATVLGAVNTGEIATNVQVQMGMVEDGLGLVMADIARGRDQTVLQAQTAGASALRATSTQPENAFVLNAAHSAAEVTGAVNQRFEAVNQIVGEAITTVIGAVNGGTIKTD